MGWSRAEILALPIDELEMWLDVAGAGKWWRKLIFDIGTRSGVEDSMTAILDDEWPT